MRGVKEAFRRLEIRWVEEKVGLDGAIGLRDVARYVCGLGFMLEDPALFAYFYCTRSHVASLQTPSS